MIKDGLVFLIDAPMSFIHDNQVKVAHGKELFAVFGFGIVNAIHHSRVGRKDHPAFRVVLAV